MVSIHRLSGLTQRAGVLACVAALVGCAHNASIPQAQAALVPEAAGTAAGSVRFTQEDEHLVARTRITGLAPNTAYTFHISDSADCAQAPRDVPSGHEHGVLSLKADGLGRVLGVFEVGGAYQAARPALLWGKTVMLHGGGGRVACGIIENTLPKMPVTPSPTRASLQR